jgi:hypothetical protein
MKILFVCSLAMLISSALQADPTRPAPGWQSVKVAADAEATALPTLQLIKQTRQGRVALIDGNLLRQGERYQQYRIKQIQDSGVILEINDEQLMLPLLNTAIKHYEE